MAKDSGPSGGIGICGLTFIVFLVLKLAEIGAVATWSWWWVTSPIWIPIALLVIGFLLFLAYKIVKDS